MIQIYASTGSPGAKDHPSLAVMGHVLAKRTGSTGEPALPGKASLGMEGYKKAMGLHKASAADPWNRLPCSMNTLSLGLTEKLAVLP